MNNLTQKHHQISCIGSNNFQIAIPSEFTGILHKECKRNRISADTELNEEQFVWATETSMEQEQDITHGYIFGGTMGKY